MCIIVWTSTNHNQLFPLPTSLICTYIVLVGLSGGFSRQNWIYEYTFPIIATKQRKWNRWLCYVCHIFYMLTYFLYLLPFEMFKETVSTFIRFHKHSETFSTSMKQHTPVNYYRYCEGNSWVWDMLFRFIINSLLSHMVKQKPKVNPGAKIPETMNFHLLKWFWKWQTFTAACLPSAEEQPF